MGLNKETHNEIVHKESHICLDCGKILVPKEELEEALKSQKEPFYWESEAKRALERADSYEKELKSQKAKIIQIGEGMKAGEIGASEGNRTVELSENIWARLEGSHNPTWIAAEIHNLALSNYQKNIEKA